jgi:hypothetical protein
MHTGSDAVATGRVVEIHPISASALARLRVDSTITEQILGGSGAERGTKATGPSQRASEQELAVS